MFGIAPAAEAAPGVDMKTLHAKIGELTLENDFLAVALGKAGLLSRCPTGHRAAMSRKGAQTMIDRTHKLSLGRQANAPGISRGSACYLPRPVSDADLTLMRRTGELHLEYPFVGSPRLKGWLNDEGHQAGRCHVAMLPVVTLLRTALPGSG